ncbi:hypothetical protein [Streptococcus suis]|uniref:Uncharacterized protein n=1 Tax=Streptococcus suis TaxID=1307 RepID=A0A0Z8IVC4_STRSU|nr:Uncharacterised protein [Streptococcus suis]
MKEQEIIKTLKKSVSAIESLFGKNVDKALTDYGWGVYTASKRLVDNLDVAIDEQSIDDTTSR